MTEELLVKTDNNYLLVLTHQILNSATVLTNPKALEAEGQRTD
jgi:hypothetical protein